MKYEDIVVEENLGTSYIVKVRGKDEPLVLYVGADTPDDIICLHDGWDEKEYFKDDIVEIVSEVEYEPDEDCFDEYDCIDWKELEKYMVQPNVFQYDTKEEAHIIMKLLDNPFLADSVYNTKLEELLDKEYGLMFYWSEYDDFSCYGDGYTHFVKVISGAKIV